MKICTVLVDGKRVHASIEGSQVFALDGDLWNRAVRTDVELGSLGDLSLQVPVVPGKIICVGRNYADHAAELGNDVPPEPLIFFKPPSSLLNPGDAIQILPDMTTVHHEAELVVVIGRGGRFIPQHAAFDHVFGYTCANDVSERVYQRADGQWTRAKGFDTFCPLGPVIDTEISPDDLRVQCKVNGEIRQDASTADMVFKVPRLIEHISYVMRLDPGDIILTGTPSGVGDISPGDTVEVSVEGIGSLVNPVLAAEPHYQGE